MAENELAVYTKEELNEACIAIVSIISKCKKALPKLKENSAQHTLLSRRIKALTISAELLQKALSNL